MVVAPCLNCGKKISSHAAICSHCGFRFGEVTKRDLDVFNVRKLRQRIYQLRMFTYLAITMFVVGFGWYWLESGDFTQPPSKSSLMLMCLAAIAYVVLRGMLHRARRTQIRMSQKTGPL